MAKKRLPKKIKNTYEDYKRKFYTARENLASKGKTMYDNYLLSEAEWEAMNKSFENKMNREIRQGKREKMGDINAIIVRQQTYEYSRAQAEVFREHIMRAGHGVRTVEEIMLGQFDQSKLDSFYDEMEEVYATLTTAGVRGKDAKLIISQKYFGSK